MRHSNHAVTRRNALKKGGLMVTSLVVGVPTVIGTAAAQEPTTMVVDVPPVVSADQNGKVVTAIYPGEDVADVRDLEAEVEDGHHLAFKLGPDDDDIDFVVEDVEGHADSVRSRVVFNGQHGSHVMGVFFDSSTAENWFTPDDNRAKLSAVERNDDGELTRMIAWGSDSNINVRG